MDTYPRSASVPVLPGEHHAALYDEVSVYISTGMDTYPRTASVPVLPGEHHAALYDDVHVGVGRLPPAPGLRREGVPRRHCPLSLLRVPTHHCGKCAVFLKEFTCSRYDPSFTKRN